MRILLLLLLVPLLPLTASPARAESDPALVDWLRRSFEAGNVPGMAVTVTRDDEVLFAGGLGVDGRGDPMTAGTPLRVASLTKTVTSVAVHQLVQAGRIALDDPVADHLPEFTLADPRYESITVQQLLDNRSGMADAEFDLAELNRSASLREYVAGMAEADLAFEPGSDKAYCNPNWEVLARMVEVVSGQDYDDYLRQHVFEPLGMTHSTVDSSDVTVPGGYQELFGMHFSRHDDSLFMAGSGSNGLVTTAEDLALWTRWVAAGEAATEILDPDLRQSMIDRAVDMDGADGLETALDRIGKSGMQFTELTHLRADPETGIGATVLVNDNDLAGPALALADASIDFVEGADPAPVGSGWQWRVAAYALPMLLGLGLGALGVARAARWASRRRGAGVGRIAARLSWLLVPLVLVALLPWSATLLTGGERTLTWSQTTYLLLNPLVVLSLLAATGLIVLTARIRALRQRHEVPA